MQKPLFLSLSIMSLLAAIASFVFHIPVTLEEGPAQTLGETLEDGEARFGPYFLEPGEYIAKASVDERFKKPGELEVIETDSQEVIFTQPVEFRTERSPRVNFFVIEPGSYSLLLRSESIYFLRSRSSIGGGIYHVTGYLPWIFFAGFALFLYPVVTAEPGPNLTVTRQSKAISQGSHLGAEQEFPYFLTANPNPQRLHFRQDSLREKLQLGIAAVTLLPACWIFVELYLGDFKGKGVLVLGLLLTLFGAVALFFRFLSDDRTEIAFDNDMISDVRVYHGGAVQIVKVVGKLSDVTAIYVFRTTVSRRNSSGSGTYKMPVYHPCLLFRDNSIHIVCNRDNSDRFSTNEFVRRLGGWLNKPYYEIPEKSVVKTKDGKSGVVTYTA